MPGPNRGPRGLLDQSTDVFYPRGWEGGLLGLGNPLIQADMQDRRQREIADTARLELQQRGLAEGTDARKKAIVAGLLAGPSPYDDPMAAAFGGPSAMGIVRGFHGTPHTFAPVPENPFGAFDRAKVGTGEGYAAYGHGDAYMGEAKGTAESYANMNGERGNVYSVEHPAEPTDFLDRDLPFSAQSQAVKDAIAKLGIRVSPNTPGRTIYQYVAAEAAKRLEALQRERLHNPLYDPVGGSRLLEEAGVPGMRYLDQFSRGGNGASHNYIVFDGSKLKITGRE